MNQPAKRTVLISGASIAGESLAYWLDRYGFAVTVVEKAPTVRGGGYAIDIRGTARDAVDRMGLLTQLRAANVGTRKISFLDGDGNLVAAISPDAVTGSEENLDLEVRRGDLARVLYAPIRDTVEFVFDDSIATLADDGSQVQVTLDSGTRRTFDLVIGADGLHSHTRRLVFGPEETFHRYLGYVFAGFSLRNDFGLDHEGVDWNVPGKSAILYAYEPSELIHGFLIFTAKEPPLDAFRHPAVQRDLVAAAFPEHAWHVQDLVTAMRTADDLFFDTVSQIHMPAWSHGRVALVGDAAYAPSFQTGQGSSLALVGSYILAGELASHADHAAAFAAYEHEVRPFVEQNQALAGSPGGSFTTPATQEALDARNKTLRDPAALAGGGDERLAAHSSLVLPGLQSTTMSAMNSF